MRVFVTGASGFIGTRIVKELLANGHQVLGLARSDASASALTALGAEVHRGNLDDLESLRSGASASDGVIHCAFDHEAAFAGGPAAFAEVCQKDKRLIEAMGETLIGSNRPLLITSGVGMGAGSPGELADEDRFDANNPNHRKASEEAGIALLERGVSVTVVRLPQVHDTVKQGLVSYLVPSARDKQVSAYVGDGLNRWCAAHVDDVAHLYRLALEKNAPGSQYNAVAEEEVTLKDIAETIGKGLNVPARGLSPEEAQAHFGWFAAFVGMDMPASGAKTRERLNWTPTGPGLITDLENMQY